MSVTEPERLEPFDFAKIVAGHLGEFDPEETAETSGETEDTPEGPAVSTEENATEETEETVVVDARGRKHGVDGKFVGAESEEAPELEEAVESEEVEEIILNIEDPALQAYLEKYDGDVIEALKAANSAQGVIGRQGLELGSVKSELAEIKQILQHRAEPMIPITRELIENEPAQAAALAVKQANVEALTAAIDVWKEYEPFEAGLFVSNLQFDLRLDDLRQEYEGRTAAPAAPSQSEVDAEVAKVITAHPDIEKFLPAIGKIARERPYLQAALESGSPKEKAAALEDAYALARSQDTDTSREAIKRVVLKTQDETRKARADAAVVTAGRRSAATSDQPTGADLFRQAFRQRFIDKTVD